MTFTLPLPSIPFDTSLYTTARTDKYGRFTLDAGKHRYSASPALCEETVRLHIIVPFLQLSRVYERNR